MKRTNPQTPLFIHDCGFHSSLGKTPQSIHRGLSLGHCKHMMYEDGLLNSGKPTVVGRVTETLPTLPHPLMAFDSRNNRLALSALQQIEPSIRQAIRRYGSDRVAVIIGTSTSGISDGETAYAHKLATGQFPHDFHYSKQELGNTSEFIRRYLNINGPSYSISTACSSSGRVFISAKRLLKAGIVDAVLVGGADTICALTLNGFNSLEALSNTLCRPFDENRNGINIGESAAFMLLSKEAPANDDNPIALLGVGDSSDAHHISAPHPEGDGAVQAMEKALTDAGMEPEDIGYINAHGTATPLNDRMESKAICRVFSQSVPVSSTKPLTGHTLGAASATEAAIAWHILKHDLLLPTQHCQSKAADIEVTLVENKTKLNGKAILSNSFAFGGNNVSLIFGTLHA